MVSTMNSTRTQANTFLLKFGNQVCLCSCAGLCPDMMDVTDVTATISHLTQPKRPCSLLAAYSK